ncbi:ABC transporter ATP-binding protein [Mycolicibacterium sp. XJ1819]
MLRALMWRYLAPFRWLVVAVIFLQVISSMAALYLPTINASIIDDGVTKGETAVILQLGAVMLAITGLQVLCAIGAVYFGSRSGMGLGRDLRAAVFRHITGFSAAETTRFGAPSLLTRSTNDVWHIEVLVEMTFTVLVTAPIMGIGGTLMAIRQDVGLSWLLLVSVPILGLANYWIVSHLLPVFRYMQDLIDVLNRVLREQLSGLKVIRAFGRELFERRRFDGVNEALADATLAAARWQALLPPASTLVINVSSVALIWFGGLRIDAGQMQVGSLIAFLSYFMQILMAVSMATTFLAMLPRAAICAERIADVLSTPPSIASPPGAVRPESVTGVVELVDVEFRYPGAQRSVLQAVTLTARPGTTTAVVGGTGSGKSTLVSLICRLFDVTAGSVRIDGVDVRHYDIERLWGAVGLVPQRGYLFSGTVADNLRYGKTDATEEEMWDALEVAAVDEFVRNRGGLQTVVSQGGANFSGGQRQRLAIARAVIRRPAIYLVDDAFSALDVHTENQVRSALRRAAAESTVILVSQRVPTVIDADQIVVIDDGMVVGEGSHRSLLIDCPTYAEIALSQGIDATSR